MIGVWFKLASSSLELSEMSSQPYLEWEVAHFVSVQLVVVGVIIVVIVVGVIVDGIVGVDSKLSVGVLRTAQK